MSSRITLIQGHPDPAGGHFCHALADAYAAAAAAAGRELRRIDVAQLPIAWLANEQAFQSDPVSEPLLMAQEQIRWADHVVVVHPLWFGMMPARLKAFFEQVLRPGFSHRAEPRRFPEALLGGRSAHVVVTMAMPAPVYRWWYGGHGTRALRRSILGFCGFAPVRETRIGLVSVPAVRERALQRLARLGAQGR
ncbi:NAD(P)H-dependent oxidoreductase [Tahibacter caeni]|uniref:NAD(P)H-dependent oxidoreductase n=1 Tax=Tahibacter caeni TaxID=1453545 RepID=UPI0021498C51|nr:NAD(P)H-dependent oxidoreductase [Tahibacter caeni]